MPTEATTAPPITHDPWCHNHEDLGYGCASEPATVAGITSWVKRTPAGVVAVIGDDDTSREQLADLAERVTVLRGLVCAPVTAATPL